MMKHTLLTPQLGTEVTGLDLANLSDGEFDAINELFLERMVLVFRGQDISRDEHKAFGRRFGALHSHPAKRSLGAGGDPEIFDIKATPNSKHANGEAWHNDLPCELEPPLGSALYMRELPSVGGDTLFANMYEAYDSLSEPVQELLELRSETQTRSGLSPGDPSGRPVPSGHRETGTVRVRQFHRPDL
jgi:taurine dioxygenase